MTTFKGLLFILQNSDATIQSRIVPATKTYGYFGRIPFHFYLYAHIGHWDIPDKE